jgi:hypothetical protein
LFSVFLSGVGRPADGQRGQGFLKHFRKIDIVRFPECVELRRDGEVFSDRLIPVFFGVRVHIHYQQAHKSARTGPDLFYNFISHRLLENGSLHFLMR